MPAVDQKTAVGETEPAFGIVFQGVQFFRRSVNGFSRMDLRVPQYPFHVKDVLLRNSRGGFSKLDGEIKTAKFLQACNRFLQRFREISVCLTFQNEIYVGGFIYLRGIVNIISDINNLAVRQQRSNVFAVWIPEEPCSSISINTI